MLCATPPFPPKTYRCAIWLTPQPGRFLIRSATLPGCASEGKTMLEAIQNIKDTLAEVIASYGDDIPWTEVPRPHKSYRGTVHVTLVNITLTS